MFTYVSDTKQPAIVLTINPKRSERPLRKWEKTKQKKNTENAYGARQEGSSYLNQENFREKKKTSATASKPTQLISLSSQEGALRGRSFLDEFFEKRQQGKEWGERFRLLTAFTS